MAIKSLQVLYLGSSPIEKNRLVYGLEKSEIVNTTFLAFLIRTDDSNILVDTGPHPDVVQEMVAKGIYNLDVRPEDHLPQRLKEVGLAMEDIDTVVVTHFGFDHTGWLPYLKHAEFIIQRVEYQFGLEPPAFFRASHPEKLRAPDMKWRLIDGDHILMPGLTLLFTPGHTPGQQSVMVDLPESGTIILSADAGHFQENFEKDLIPNVCVDQMQAWYSMKKIKVWAQIRKAKIFTFHDYDYWDKEMKKPPEAYT